MSKNKGVRVLVTLECTECRQGLTKRTPGVSRYATTKNRKNTPNRIELKKYCPYCNSHKNHKEVK